MAERIEQLTFSGAAPQRLDKYLVERLPEFSRTRLQNLIKDGLVLVDDLPAHKAGQMLEHGRIRPEQEILFLSVHKAGITVG